jgi:hypothetical protein
MKFIHQGRRIMETHLPHWKVGEKAPAIRPQEGNGLGFRAPILSLEKRTRYEAIVNLRPLMNEAHS